MTRFPSAAVTIIRREFIKINSWWSRISCRCHLKYLEVEIENVRKAGGRRRSLFLPDQRFEDVPDDSDEVCGMNDVQSLQVLLVSVKHRRSSNKQFVF